MDGRGALEEFAEQVDVVTFEFENVLPEATSILAEHAPVRPSVEVLATCRNRRREKEFLSQRGFPVPRFHIVASETELRSAAESLGYPCVAKTIEGGYDGKGQFKITNPDEAGSAWVSARQPSLIVEAWVPFIAELSVIAARSPSGGHAVFPPAENTHRDHILDVSLLPGRFPKSTAKEAIALADSIADALRVEGLIAIEMFLTADGGLLVNEMAPRPHNSGHATIDACLTSQFEQHFRCVCDLPLGSTQLLQPAVMVNLLGDLWQNGTPDWTPILQEPNAKLHLYGKAEARPGRKMGHFTVLGESPESAMRCASAIRERIGLPSLA